MTNAAARPPALGDSPGVIEVHAPADGRLLRTVPDMDAHTVAAHAAIARAAQPGWDRLGFDGRGRVLRRGSKWVLDNRDEIIATICSESGKTWEDALTAEVTYAAAAFRFWAAKAPKYLADERVRSTSPLVAGRSFRVRHRPIGLIGVIGPWNFPLLNSFGDCIPALAAGNGVLLKPSEVTPLTSLLMLRCLRDCGAPDGILSVVTGRGATGQAVVDEADFVMFTGSTATGRKVLQRAARTLTPVALELGGKDPMIVLADADVERAANAAVQYATNNAGQFCISTERVYVEDAIYEGFVERVVAKVRRLRQGPPAGRGSVDIGAITHPPQLEIIDRHVRDARDRGARVLVGGERPEPPSQFYPPTVLVDVDHTMKVMTDESFGPLLPIMRVRDATQAVELANDSRYGLGASVFSRDAARATAVAEQLQSGTVCINDAQLNYAALEVPMGGVKQSGIGTRHAAGGIRKFTVNQTVMTNRWPLTRDLHFFPYTARATRLIEAGMRVWWGWRRT